MIDFIENFHFLRPWMLLFLLIPLGLFFKKIKASHVSSWADICDKHLLNFLVINENNVRKINLKKFIYIGLVVACISVAGPSWKKIEIPSFSIENPNIFILSLAQDMQLTDVPPSRLERAKYMISDIADNISVQGQFGIMVYSEEPYLISPFTDDISLIKSLLYQIVPDIVPDNGDRLDRAILLALERFKAAGYSKGNIILLASDVGQRFDLALQNTKNAVSLGYDINVIDTSFDGNEKLKMLADTGNGVYLRIFDTSTKDLVEKIKQIDTQNLQKNKNMRSTYIDFGYYLVFIPLFCLLLFFRKGLLVLLFFLISFDVNASFLLNKNQEGLKLFKQEQYDLAKDTFDDEYWQGISLYKLNNYEEALNKFNKITSSDGFYNKGVTLVKLCKYKEALEAFNESYKIDKKNEDAKYNIDVLTKLFEDAKEKPELLNCQNNQQQQQNQNDNNDKNNNEKNQNNDENNGNGKNNNENNQNNDKNSSNEKNNSENKDKNQQQDKNDKQNDNNENTSDNSENKQEDSNKNQDDQQQNQNDNSENNGDDKQSKTDENRESSNKKDSSASTKNKNSDLDKEDKQKAKSLLAKEGDENEKYDEEAMAMQRLYREIPEDVGGLLREFIKKEYMKDRYNNENM